MKQQQSGTAADPAVVHFVGVGKEFCRLLELKRRRSKRRFVERVLKSTLVLYRAGLELPDVRPEPGYSSLGEWYQQHKHLPLKERINQDPKIREHSKLHRTI